MRCGDSNPPVHVHGHTQCGRCGSELEGCCEGAATCPPSPPVTTVKESASDERSEEHTNDDISEDWETT